MPTKAFDQLLSRDIRKAEARSTIGDSCALLTEIVNHATNAFQRCQEEMKTGLPDEHLPVLLEYYHIIEMTDGIQVLISESCVVPAIPLLRSSFEALLSLEYILDKQSQQRSFAWLSMYTHRRLTAYRRLDPANPEYKVLEGLWLEDVGEAMRLPKTWSPSYALAGVLNRPGYADAEQEYQRLKSSKQRFEWFTFYGGPKTIQSLARTLKHGAQYELLYRQWSGISHAEDLSHFLTRGAEHKAAFRPLRNHQQMHEVVRNASQLALEATRMMLGKYRHGEEKSIARWYASEIQRYFSSPVR
jgi:hypothetical protein